MLIGNTFLCPVPEYCLGCTCDDVLGLCCPLGQFFNSGSCEDCAENCVTCTGTATTCTSCTDPTPILEEGTCISCPDGQYSNDGICENCDDNCGTCSGSATNCLSCNSPFPKLNGNSCEECDRGNYDNGSDSCESCNQENCPPFSEPIAETQWSIYKPQCIRWDINTIDQSETTVTLSLEYGPDFAREFVIKENIFVTLEQYEWKVVGVLPGSTSRIKMKFNSSGKVRYSETYVIAPPFLPYSNPC